VFGSYGGGSGLMEATPVTVAAGERRGDLDIALAAVPAGLGPSATPGTRPSTSSAGPPAGSPSPNDGGSPAGAGAPSAGVGLANSRVKARNDHSVIVRLTCSSDHGCDGRLVLTAKRALRRGRRVLDETVTIGAARFETKRGSY